MLGSVAFAVLERREGRVVALVEQFGPDLGGLLASAELADPVEHPAAEVVQPHVEGEEDVLLAFEVVVEGGLGRAETVGDLAKRGLVVALLVEQLELLDAP